MQQITVPAPPPPPAASIATLSTALKTLELHIAEMTAQARKLMIQYDGAPPISGMSARERAAYDQLGKDITALRTDIATSEASRDLLKFRLTQAIEEQVGVGAPPGTAVTVVPPTVPGLDRQSTMLGLVITGLVLAPLAFAVAWRLIRKATPPMSTRALADTNERIQRIEQTVESIAIEIERMSEHQRFITQAMVGTPTPLPRRQHEEEEHPTPV